MAIKKKLTNLPKPNCPVTNLPCEYYGTCMRTEESQYSYWLYGCHLVDEGLPMYFGKPDYSVENRNIRNGK